MGDEIDNAPTIDENDCELGSYSPPTPLAVAGGFAIGYFMILYISSIVKRRCCDIVNIFFMGLASAVSGLGVGYGVHILTAEEYCDPSIDSTDSYVINTAVGAMVVIFTWVELGLDLVCCDGNRSQYGFIYTRLLGPHKTRLNADWRWWSATLLSLGLGGLSMAAVVYDAVMAMHSWWVILLFSAWECFWFVFCLASAFSSDGCFQECHREFVFLMVKWMLLDIPGLIAVVSGLGGELPPVIAQFVLEGVCYIATREEPKV